MLRRLQQIQQEGFTVDISSILGNAWETLKPQIGIFILFNLISVAVIVAVQLIVPIASMFTTPFLMMANYHAFRESDEGRTVTFNTFFEITSLPTFANTFIAYLVMNVIIFGVFFVLFLLFGGIGLGAALSYGDLDTLETNTSAMATIGVIAAIGILILIGAMFYVTCIYMLLIPTVFFATDGTGWWELMEASRKAMARNWGMLLLLSIVLGLILVFGCIFTLFIGFIVLMPFFYAVQYVLFRDIIGFEDGADEGKNDITQHFVL